MQTALITDRLPLDVHTIVLGYLNLQDSISLLRTSSALYFTRYLWAVVLDQARKLRPLPCPPDQDFFDLATDFAELRELAFTTCKLEQNWSQERPQYKSVMQVHTTSSRKLPIAIVPGLRIVITTALQERQLQCWNMANQSCVGIIENVHLAIEQQTVLLACSGSPSRYRPHVGNDRFTLGLVACNNSILDSSARVVVVSVDYSDRNAIKFTENFRSPLLLPSPPYKTADAHIAMSSSSTGFIVYHNHDTISEAYCAAFDGTSALMNPIRIPLLPAHLYVETLYVYRGFLHICILNKDIGDVDVVSLSGSELLTELGYTDTPRVLRDNPYTTFAYNTRVIHSSAARPSGYEIYMWMTGKERYNFKFPYQKTIGCYGFVPGTDTTHSCFLKFGKPDQCFLFRLHPDVAPPTFTRHSLSLPPTVTQAFIDHCPALVDEHFGVIYVFSKDMIHALSYV